jgi:hypothetical protein
LQGDEILIDPKNIDSVIESCKGLNKKFILNAICKLSKPEELTDISIVKCLLSENNNVISLFRNTPLTCEKKIQLKHVYKVSGLFAYYKSTLSKILTIPTGKIQEIELIEQFKLIENDIQIKTIKINDDGNSLNTPTDLKQIRKILITKNMICFDLFEIPPFSTTLIAEALSHEIEGLSKLTITTLRKLNNDTNSRVHSDNAIYSASKDDNTTEECNFDFQKNKVLPRNIPYP